MDEQDFAKPWYQEELGRCKFGLAWAARRSLLDAHGFYDAFILGSATVQWRPPRLAGSRRRSRPAVLILDPADHYRGWAVPFFQTVRGNVGCLTGRIYHLWHGEIAARRYRERHIDFWPFDFDPYSDIKIDAGGAFVWSSDKPAMHAYIHRYFHQRNEDGSGD